MAIFEQAVKNELSSDTMYRIYDTSKDEFVILYDAIARDRTIFRGTISAITILEPFFSNIDKNDLKNFIIFPIIKDKSGDPDFRRSIAFSEFIGDIK